VVVCWRPGVHRAQLCAGIAIWRRRCRHYSEHQLRVYLPWYPRNIPNQVPYATGLGPTRACHGDNLGRRSILGPALAWDCTLQSPAETSHRDRGCVHHRMGRGTGLVCSRSKVFARDRNGVTGNLKKSHGSQMPRAAGCKT